MLEAAVWAIGRWADTYLLSEEDLSPAMSQAFGPAGNGPAVLTALVQVAGTLLGGQAGEVELHTAVCTRLLSVLVRRRHVSHRLVQLQPWHNLAGRTWPLAFILCVVHVPQEYLHRFLLVQTYFYLFKALRRSSGMFCCCTSCMGPRFGETHVTGSLHPQLHH